MQMAIMTHMVSGGKSMDKWMNGVNLVSLKATSIPATNCTSNIQGPWGFPGGLIV